MEERELRRALSPQSHLDLILELDLGKEFIDARSTIIYDWGEKDTLILAQTSPPILRSNIGRKIQASFVVYDRVSNERKRYGYETTILELLPQYELRVDVFEPAVVIGYPTGELAEVPIRLHCRVEPTSEHGLTAQLKDISGETHVIDISLGGLLLSYDGRTEFLGRQQLRVDFYIKEQHVPLLTEVVRAYTIEGSRLTYLALKYVDLEPPVMRLIQDTVSAIMRDELRARSGLYIQEEPLATPRMRR